jgi:hypothetical protein
MEDLAAILAGGVALGGYWFAFLRRRQTVRPESPDPLDQGTEVPPWLAPLYPLLWPILTGLPALSGGARREGLPARIARSGYYPYATVSAVWADRLRGLALGILGMLAGAFLLGPALGSPLPGVLAGTVLGVYGLIRPERRIEAAIADRRRRFRANMLVVLAAARGFIRSGRAWDDAFSRAAAGDGVFANWVRFLIARYAARGEAGLREAMLHAPDPRDPYLVRFMDAVRLAASGGAGFEIILSTLVEDLGAAMEQEVAERVTAVEPYVLGAGILAIIGYVGALFLQMMTGTESMLGF